MTISAKLRQLVVKVIEEVSKYFSEHLRKLEISLKSYGFISWTTFYCVKAAKPLREDS